ncbi:beta-glucosidase [Cadophora sp. MPI-SDFR-AT-0126]|nr:beta-glucosidase [Leotiomycetes sp. MPI-SDFR-AT-0126]
MSTVLHFGLFVLATPFTALVQGVGFEPSAASVNRPLSIDVAREKANAFIAQLNLTEKVALVTGAGGNCIGNIAPIPRLNFSGLCLADGPSGVNRNDLVSVFPAGLTAAASWDKALVYQRGFALGSEFKGKGVHVGLGPVAGPLGRHGLGGRNWEGFSPDPYLTGWMMDSSVRGMQDAGVQSCSKHFIGNEQETQRSNTVSSDGASIDAISSNIDDRTMHELYLWPFYDAVKAGTASIMCSYNRLNQTYACENHAILDEILKGELGFEGYVMSDWFATHSGVASINGGLDMTMPGSTDQASFGIGGVANSFFGGNLTAAVNNGSVSMTRLDDMVRRILLPYYSLRQDESYPTVDPSMIAILLATYLSGSANIPARDVRGNHATLIRELGFAGTVLLKNLNSALPLRSPKNIGVFGNDAPDPTEGLTQVTDYDEWGFNFGTLDIGGGSGTARHTNLVSPLEAIKARARQTGARVQYLTDNAVIATNDFSTIYPTPDVCLVFLKTYAEESADRTAYEANWNSTLVVENVARRCPNTVVVTHSGGINTMPWAQNANVTAILAAHFPGEESGNSIVDILWGDVNPSGRLPYTIPVHAADYDIPIVNLTNVTSPSAWQSNFTEGQFIDYRHFDARDITPLYEFGYGLSYTNFSLHDKLSASALLPNPARTPNSLLKTAPGGNPDLWTHLATLETEVSNTGAVAGSTVLQLYISLPQDAVPEGTPLKVLRGFEKIHLNPGEKQKVTFFLTRRDLSYWDTAAQAWALPTGRIKFQTGFSSKNLIQSATLAMRK